MKKIILFIFLAINQLGISQISNYNLVLEPLTIQGLQGIQSFAFGQFEGKWLVVGGRLDGLHRRQPWASFDANGNNNQLIVIDPVNKLKWSRPLSELPTSIQEQLSSTNPNFFQDGNTLYYVGGYGYSVTAVNHITYPKLTAINLQGVISGIMNNLPITQYFRQITDNAFAVSGGRIEKIYETFYLVGGHRFDGRYNPANNPTFTQAYTNQIRKFNIIDDGINLQITHLSPFTDTANLHRRDYNVAPQIMPDGSEGITAFSGVFQLTADLPYLNCVNIDSNGYQVNNNFSQYYNHYHCAHLPVYDSINNEMHTFFFGGISQYYDSSGVLVQDNNVPFVKTIARVSRDASGIMAEYKLAIDMPGLLGSGSEFIANKQISHYENNVLRLNEMQSDTILAGYIYGGISSTLPNIFFINTGMESSASSQIYKVLFVNSSPSNIATLNPQSIGSLHIQVYPNPNGGDFSINYHLKQTTDVSIVIYDSVGKMLNNEVIKSSTKGNKVFSTELNNGNTTGIYFVTLKTSYETASQKIIVE